MKNGASGDRHTPLGPYRAGPNDNSSMKKGPMAADLGSASVAARRHAQAQHCRFDVASTNQRSL
jgi:hypothetical protein